MKYDDDVKKKFKSIVDVFESRELNEVENSHLTEKEEQKRTIEDLVPLSLYVFTRK